jgi:hypothetical protein
LRKDATGEEQIDPPIVFTHKRCCRAFEMAHGRATGAIWCADELSLFPLYLSRNLEIDHEEAIRDAGLGL